MFWIFGLLLCLWVGPAQASSRSFLARLAPDGPEGEMFGLYATTGRAASFLAPGLFALFSGVVRPTGWVSSGSRWCCWPGRMRTDLGEAAAEAPASVGLR